MSLTLACFCQKRFTNLQMKSATAVKINLSLLSKTKHSLSKSKTILTCQRLRTPKNSSTLVSAIVLCVHSQSNKWINSLPSTSGFRLMITLSEPTSKSSFLKNLAQKTKKCGQIKRSLQIWSDFSGQPRARVSPKPSKKSFCMKFLVLEPKQVNFLQNFSESISSCLKKMKYTFWLTISRLWKEINKKEKKEFDKKRKPIGISIVKM